MLSIEHVTKKYGSFTALEDISLRLENGLYGLLAPNGAGKTTLMRMLATLLYPNEGKIYWESEDIYAMGERYRNLIGYLPQQFGYYRNETAKSFLLYLSALKGIEHVQAEKRIEELMRQIGLDPDEKKKLKQYSGGMIQRVGIVQALLNDPKLLILDEPTAGLDPKERARFRSLVRKLAEERTVILSTHIVSDVESVADQIILIREKKIYGCCKPKELIQSLSGKIYELPIACEMLPHCTVLSERTGETGTVVRVYSEMPVPEGKAVSPILEDVFLKIYGDEE